MSIGKKFIYLFFFFDNIRFSTQRVTKLARSCLSDLENNNLCLLPCPAFLADPSFIRYKSYKREKEVTYGRLYANITLGSMARGGEGGSEGGESTRGFA